MTLDEAVVALGAPGGFITQREFDALARSLRVPGADLHAQLRQRHLRVAIPPRLPRMPSIVNTAEMARALDMLSCRHLVDFLVDRSRGPFRVVDGLWFETETFRTEKLGRAWLAQVKERWAARSDHRHQRAALWLVDHLEEVLEHDPMGMRHVALVQIAGALQARLNEGVAVDSLAVEATRLGVHEVEAGLVAFAVAEWARTHRPGAIEELTAAWNARQLNTARRMIKAMGPEREDPDVARLIGLVRDAYRELSSLLDTGRAAEQAGDLEAAAAAYVAAGALVSDLPELSPALERCPPPAPPSLSAGGSGAEVHLAWTPAPARVGAISYRVTRNTDPRGTDEGVVVADTADCNAVDRDPPLGQQLHYAVRTGRDRSAWSPQSTAAPPVVLAPDVSTLRARSRSGIVEMTWETRSAMRVLVTRTDGQLAPATHLDGLQRWEGGPGRFLDHDVIPGHTYSYRVTAVYRSSAGLDVLSSGVSATLTPDADPVPVDALEVTLDGSRPALRISWSGETSDKVTILETQAPLPMDRREIVPIGELDAFPGIRRSPGDQAERSLEVPAQAGERHYTAVTTRGDNAAIGPSRQMVIQPPVTDLKTHRFRTELRLQWLWPAESGQALVLIKRGSVPTSDDDPEAEQRVVPRSTYGLEHGCRIPLANGTHGVAVFAVRSDSSGRHLGLPATALVGPIGAERSIAYEIVRRWRLAGVERTLRIVTHDSVPEPLDLVLMARPGDILPLAVDDPACAEVLRMPSVTLTPGTPVVREVHLGPVRRPCYLRCFVDGSGAGAVRIVDPPRDQLIVNR